jgi:hypothetical protein
MLWQVPRLAVGAAVPQRPAALAHLVAAPGGGEGAAPGACSAPAPRLPPRRSCGAAAATLIRHCCRPVNDCEVRHRACRRVCANSGNVGQQVGCDALRLWEIAASRHQQLQRRGDAGLGRNDSLNGGPAVGKLGQSPPNGSAASGSLGRSTSAPCSPCTACGCAQRRGGSHMRRMQQPCHPRPRPRRAPAAPQTLQRVPLTPPPPLRVHPLHLAQPLPGQPAGRLH